MSSLSVGDGIDRRSRILVNFVPPLELGVRRGKYWRREEIVLGMSWMHRSRGALELLYQGTTRAFLSESQILARIFARVSVTALNASSGDEAGIVILSSNRVSDGSVLLDRGGVAAREGSWLFALAWGVISATGSVVLGVASFGGEVGWSGGGGGGVGVDVRGRGGSWFDGLGRDRIRGFQLFCERTGPLLLVRWWA